MLNSFKEKLIAAKERWARDGRLMTGTPDPQHQSRLPPGQRLVTEWPVLDLGVQPSVTQPEWRLTVDGAVETPLSWDWPAFMAQPQVTLRVDMHCVTSWSRYDNDFTGVPALHLMDVVRPLDTARAVMLESYDGYTTNLPLSYLADDDVLLAHAWQNSPLTRDHGGPVRLIVPKLYLWKSAKWLRRIQFIEQDAPGFWEERGYHMRGDPWTEERYS